MKKETLEEAAEKYGEPYRCPATNKNEYCRHDIISAFNNGAKCQAKRMYSEEEVKDIIEQTIEKFYKHTYADKTKAEMKELWFDQFKKK